MKKAFTLIELLVVIAIIAILAAILFPVFAQAKTAAKQTQAISNLKNIGTGFQIYMADYDDTWPLWSAGMGCDAATCPAPPGESGGSSVFALRFMFPKLVDPYIKNGANSRTGELNGIWASPLSKPLLSSISNTFAYNHWTLGGFSTCARTINLLPASNATCFGRTTAAYAEFADTAYNFPAPSTVLANPAETVAVHDGAQLSRPPQFRIAFSTTDVSNIAVWGPGDLGNGNVFNANGSLSTASATIRRLMSGNRTVVSYADSHVKVVPTGTLYHVDYRSDKWRGSLTNNRGWSRDWGTN
ncbi:MAG: prepilin-type N-terminal cleavage/methylation domain-containing protein [Fimbriimonadaceae bacterium]|nr:prepilin-type N-terminal cleavage/methylation domain-containing protein [Fimbriimonadaceae bacterium]